MSPALPCSLTGPHHPHELVFSKLKKIATSIHHEPQPLPLVPTSSSDRSSSCATVPSSTPVRGHGRATSGSFHLNSALSLSIQSREATTSGAKARRGCQGGSARCGGALRRCSSTGGGAEVRPRSTLRAARLSVSSSATGSRHSAWRLPDVDHAGEQLHSMSCAGSSSRGTTPAPTVGTASCSTSSSPVR